MEREKFENIIKEINESGAESIYSVEDVCDCFYEAKPQLIKSDLDKDEHRWYEITTSVYKIGEWFLGIRGASKIYSVVFDWSDLCVKTIAFEMEEIPSVTYMEKIKPIGNQEMC